jgi:NAD(P)-dependent dehydrogenase (short-subunit alcohol dehydrogenase family)
VAAGAVGCFGHYLHGQVHVVRQPVAGLQAHRAGTARNRAAARAQLQSDAASRPAQRTQGQGIGLLAYQPAHQQQHQIKLGFDALLAGDADKACKAYRFFGRLAPPMAYAESKIAVSRWVRRHAVAPEWAGAGIRLNALAPGAIMTPMLERQLATPAEAKNVRRFPVPIGGFGDAGQLADWVVFMLSDAADFLCGSIVFVDGGSDAYFRPDEWPRPVPARGLPFYLWRTRQFSERIRS